LPVLLENVVKKAAVMKNVSAKRSSRNQDFVCYIGKAKTNQIAKIKDGWLGPYECDICPLKFRKCQQETASLAKYFLLIIF